MPTCSPRPLEQWGFWWKSGITVFLLHLCLGPMFSQISYKHPHGLACSTRKKLSITCLCDSYSSGGSFHCTFITGKSTLLHKERPIPYINCPLNLAPPDLHTLQISCICLWFRVGWCKHLIANEEQKQFLSCIKYYFRSTTKIEHTFSFSIAGNTKVL